MRERVQLPGAGRAGRGLLGFQPKLLRLPQRNRQRRAGAAQRSRGAQRRLRLGHRHAARLHGLRARLARRRRPTKCAAVGAGGLDRGHAGAVGRSDHKWRQQRRRRRRRQQRRRTVEDGHHHNRGVRAADRPPYFPSYSVIIGGAIMLYCRRRDADQATTELSPLNNYARVGQN